MLIRTDPFRELDRLADTVFGTVARPVAMPIEAYRQHDSFVVQVDLPGVAPESIDLTVEQNVLTIRAERKAPADDSVERLVAERPYGVFSRQLVLGEALDAEQLAASYDTGVLTITIPVAEKAKPRRIEVTTGVEPHKAISAA